MAAGGADTEPRRSQPSLGGGPRVLLYTFGALLLLASLTLYGFPAHTDRFFAWTIQPPVTAAFLGAGYAAGLVAVVASVRTGAWPPVRFGLEATLAFVLVTTLATALHLDRFHLAGSGAALVAAIGWMVVYVVAPVWIIVILLRYRRPRRRDAPGVVPTLARGVLMAQAVALGALGVALFLAPSTESWLWPWALTPLTARAVAGWLLMLAVAALIATRESDPKALEVPAAIYLTIAALQAGALARFPDQLEWDRPAAWVLVALLTVIAGTGLVGLVYSRRLKEV